MAHSQESSQFLLQHLAKSSSSEPCHGTDGNHNGATEAAGLCDSRHSLSSQMDPPPTGLRIRNIASSSKNNAENDTHSPPSRRQKRRGNIFLTWSLELALLLLAAGLLAALFAILYTHDHHEMPNWDNSNNGITLNALVALLATIYRAALGYVALQVMAQLKWNWVTAQFRPMLDVQRFDDASRGAWGSIQLLPLVALRQPLAVATIAIVVASLAIGPITQQTIQTYYCSRAVAARPAQTALIAVANRIDNTIYYIERPSHSVLQVEMQSAIQDAVVNQNNDTNIAMLFLCDSSNCTWTTYADHPRQPSEKRVSHASLGMCSRCEDVYDLVQKSSRDTATGTELNITLQLTDSSQLQVSPGLHSTYLNSSVTRDLIWARDVVPRSFMNAARWSVANFTILALSQDHCDKLPDGNVSCPLSSNASYKNSIEAWEEPTDYIAATCIMYPCIRHYQGSVSNGALLEKLIKTTPLRPQVPQVLYDSGGDFGRDLGATAWAEVQTPCWVNGTLYTSSNISAASEKLPPELRETVQAHLENWDREDINSPAGYVNITAPRECVMSLDPYFYKAFHYELEKSFNTYCTLLGHQTRITSCPSSSGGFSMPMAALLQRRSTSVDTIRWKFDSLALRVTADMRYAGLGPYTELGTEVKGQVLENRTCVRVAWGWFALPAALLFLCTIVLGLIVIQDWKAADDAVVWKSSVLPFLLRDHVPALEKLSLKEVDIAAAGLEPIEPGFTIHSDPIGKISSPKKETGVGQVDLRSKVGDKVADVMARFDSADEVNGFLNAFAKRGYSQVDTARVYSPHAPGSSEPRLGAVGAGERFTIDTKVLSVDPGCHTKDKILKEIDTSLAELKVKQINIEYLHMPDRTTPFEEACEAMDQAHNEGKIKHWGISNYTAAEVQQILDICKQHGYVKPSVYQGHYNAIVRGGEKELFPILRQHGMSYYAYSPAAGGFFAGAHKKVQAGGRYDSSHLIGSLYNKFYMKPSIIAAADKVAEVASKHGIGGHAAALRWTAYHSILSKEHGDSIIIGASSPEQLESNIDMVEQGPLPEDVVSAIEAVYNEIGEDEIPYHIPQYDPASPYHLSPSRDDCRHNSVLLSPREFLQPCLNRLYPKYPVISALPIMEFITLVHPSQSSSAKSKRNAHSHAARVAHARARRLRMAGYASQKGIDREGTQKQQDDIQPKNQVALRQDQTTLGPRHLPGAFEHEPFASFLKSLTPREHYIFNHYVQVVYPYMSAHCPIMQNFREYHAYMRTNWILLSSTDRDLLIGFLLASSRHLSLVQCEKEYSEIAIQYKLNCVKSLRDAISTGDPALSRAAITRALVLTLDELMLGDLAMASKHVAAAAHILQIGGGPKALGISEFVTHILFNCIYGKRLLAWEPAYPCGSEFMKPEVVRVSEV
ncbi:hypothetical protein NM208_g727 [Fusarium decemcellulare]|uniref:Uncharacterized protein n=1 Tax=Fusarium decemcellulare TaxID=57161 RepID=A0ACC1SYM1_9HYPO|nr:hypothetical protein NM208_g727 [Fusarium decemcellulare]